MRPPLMLASASPFRKMLLENAGLSFFAEAAHIDERAIEAPLEKDGASPEEVAMVLAEAKARDVAGRHPEMLVIGSDQTMSFGSRVFHKPKNMDDARAHLDALSGQTHQLNSAIVLVRDKEIVWKHVSSARLTMRSLSTAFIETYLKRVGEKVSSSVGAYQLEGEGVHLFEKIDGDYFTIIGLPMLPLLGKLRDLEIIDV